MPTRSELLRCHGATLIGYSRDLRRAAALVRRLSAARRQEAQEVLALRRAFGALSEPERRIHPHPE